MTTRCKKILPLCGAIAAMNILSMMVYPLKSLAQPVNKISSSFYLDRCNTTEDEIMVTIFGVGNVEIRVTNLVTNTSTSDIVHSNINVGDEQCDWYVSSEGSSSGRTTRVISPDTPYRIKFIQGNEVMRSFLYFQCLVPTNFADYTFMCPETSVVEKNDVYIDYFIGGSYEVWPEPFFRTSLGIEIGMRDHFEGDSWILPYDQYYATTPALQRADYFLSLQSPTSLQSGPFFYIKMLLSLAS